MSVKTDSSLLCLCFLAVLSSLPGCSTDSTTESPQPDALNGVDTATGDVAVDTATPPKDTAVADTTTTPTDTAVDDTGTADSGDAAGTCATGEWRDFSTSTCVKCAETPRVLTCNDMIVTASGGDWNATTNVLTFSMKPSTAEIVSGTATFDVSHGSGAPTSSDIPITVSGDQISMNLASFFLDTTTTRVQLTKLVLVDRCGVTSTPTAPLEHLHGAIDVATGGTTTASFFCGS